MHEVKRAFEKLRDTIVHAQNAKTPDEEIARVLKKANTEISNLSSAQTENSRGDVDAAVDAVHGLAAPLVKRGFSKREAVREVLGSNPELAQPYRAYNDDDGAARTAGSDAGAALERIVTQRAREKGVDFATAMKELEAEGDPQFQRALSEYNAS